MEAEEFPIGSLLLVKCDAPFMCKVCIVEIVGVDDDFRTYRYIKNPDHANQMHLCSETLMYRRTVEILRKWTVIKSSPSPPQDTEIEDSNHQKMIADLLKPYTPLLKLRR